jgi:hypothetical protein
VNFEGAKPISIPRYGSSVQWDDGVLLPLGLARISRNQRFSAQSTATRYGHSTQLTFGANNSLTGGGLLRYLAAQPGTLNLQAVETILLFAYGFVTGDIYACPPFLQADNLNLTNTAFFLNTGFSAFTGLNPTFRQAFNQMFVALTDLLLPTQPPLVYNSSDGILYPASDLPFGAPWNPGTYYRVGQVVSPSQFQTFGQTDGQGAWVEIQTGYLYRCTVAGVSGNAASQPTWPLSFDGTVTDNAVTWEECTPIFISGLPDAPAPITPTSASDGGSPIIAGATVYLAATLLNTVGEGINDLVNIQGTLDPKKVLTWVNTTGGPVDLTVVMPAIQAYLLTSGSLGATYGATHLNLYAFIDPSSDADPSSIVDPSFYALVNSSPVLPGASITISAYPTGAELSAVSTAATTATIGNVDTGVRYLTTFFQTETTYQTGFSNSAPQSVNVTQSGWPIQCLRLPIGPYNCQARVVGSTVSGASAAGPFTYISQADIESPGFNQANVAITATLVEDNTSTTALFNFTDTYLPGATDVTNYFDKIQLPPVVDIYFAKSIQRVVYTGAVGYQSGHLFSDIQDPETVRVPGGNFQVSENDGDRTVCYREIRGIGYSFKENSGFVVEQNGGDPSTWTPRQVWGGNGPVGPAAIDVAGQDDSEFAMWAHRSGLYLFTGNAPTLISREQQDTWETINWDYGHLIKVRIDHVRRLVHILVPINGSTTINCRLVLNYYFGTGDPVVFVQRRGILVPNVEGRKWSQDDLLFNDALYIPQKSKNAVQLAGVNVANQMVFFAADGSIKNMVDGQYYDEDYNGNQVGYFSNWIGVLGESPSTSHDKLVGARMWCTGNGLCNVTAYDDQDNPYLLTVALSPYLLTPGVRSRMDIPMPIQGVFSMRWAVGMDNMGVAGAWWEVFKSDLMVIPTWPGQPG